MILGRSSYVTRAGEFIERPPLIEDFVTILRLTLVSVRGYDVGLNRWEFVVPCDEFLGGGWMWRHGSIADSRPGLLSSSAQES